MDDLDTISAHYTGATDIQMRWTCKNCGKKIAIDGYVVFGPFKHTCECGHKVSATIRPGIPEGTDD